jgi:hypothetical protein
MNVESLKENIKGKRILVHTGSTVYKGKVHKFISKVSENGGIDYFPDDAFLLSFKEGRDGLYLLNGKSIWEPTNSFGDEQLLHFPKDGKKGGEWKIYDVTGKHELTKKVKRHGYFSNSISDNLESQIIYRQSLLDK